MIARSYHSIGQGSHHPLFDFLLSPGHHPVQAQPPRLELPRLCSRRWQNSPATTPFAKPCFSVAVKVGVGPIECIRRVVAKLAVQESPVAQPDCPVAIRVTGEGGKGLQCDSRRDGRPDAGANVLSPSSAGENHAPNCPSACALMTRPPRSTEPREAGGVPCDSSAGSLSCSVLQAFPESRTSACQTASVLARRSLILLPH